jgi:hypothetical protein
VGGVWGELRRRLSRLFGSDERPEQHEAKLVLSVHLAEEAAQELYRSLLPGERILVLPPAGLVLPDIGQELPRSLRPGRAPTPPQAGPQAAPGVPFRIPAPVEAGAPSNGEPAAPLPAEEQAPPGTVVGEPGSVPAQRLDVPPPAAAPAGDANAQDIPQSTPAPTSGPQ